MTAKETRAVLTASALERSLKQLGVRQGGTLIVHSSMSALGYVIHGVNALLAGLRGALGPSGTLLVPGFTGEFTDPSCWVDPALPPSLWNRVREEMPFFDGRRSLPRLMGQLSLAALLDPEARRSEHPVASWIALGASAGELLESHDLRDPFGPESPLGRAKERRAQVLLLGVDQRSNSALMHAHVLADVPQVRRDKGAFLASVAGQRQWITPSRFVECTAGYAKLEDYFVSSGLLRVGRIGDSDCRLMELRPLVDAVQHIVRTEPRRVFCGQAGCRQCVEVGAAAAAPEPPSP